MIIEHNDGLRKLYENLTNEEVIQKTQEALEDPTVESITTYKMTRQERRKAERAANRKPGKRRTYR